MREGIDGFFGDDIAHLASLVDRVSTLDRAEIRGDVIDRFSASRMADGYEDLMRSVIGEASGRDAAPETGEAAPEPLRPRVKPGHPATPSDVVAI